MRFYEVFIELLSPALITSKRTERGFLSPLNHIPSTTIRGALLSSLHYSKLLDADRLESESRSPSVFTSPAYPSIDGEKSYPCHPFAYECKIPHDGDRERVIYAYEVLEELESGGEPDLRISCSRGHVASAEDVHPHPVVPAGGTFEKPKLACEHVVCVGMSGDRGASRRQLLYEYEAISAGQSFWFRLAAPDDILENLEKNAELYIGRGISRGFGRARILRIEDGPVEELGEKIRQAYSVKQLIALYSLSHIIPAQGCADYINVIDLEEVGVGYGIKASGKVLLRKIYGRRGKLQLGWDMKIGRRPAIKPAWRPGSIAVAELKDLGGEWWKALAALSYKGSSENVADDAGRIWPVVGVNFMEPLRFSPMLGGRR